MIWKCWITAKKQPETKVQKLPFNLTTEGQKKNHYIYSITPPTHTLCKLPTSTTWSEDLTTSFTWGSRRCGWRGRLRLRWSSSRCCCTSHSTPGGDGNPTLVTHGKSVPTRHTWHSWALHCPCKFRFCVHSPVSHPVSPGLGGRRKCWCTPWSRRPRPSRSCPTSWEDREHVFVMESDFVQRINRFFSFRW